MVNNISAVATQNQVQPAIIQSIIRLEITRLPSFFLLAVVPMKRKHSSLLENKNAAGFFTILSSPCPISIIAMSCTMKWMINIVDIMLVLILFFFIIATEFFYYCQVISLYRFLMRTVLIFLLPYNCSCCCAELFLDWSDFVVYIVHKCTELK